jgi:hypothetical protein
MKRNKSKGNYVNNFTVFCAKRNAPTGLVASQAFLTIVRNGLSTAAFAPSYQNALDVTGAALRRLADLARACVELANERIAKFEAQAASEFAGDA